LFVLVHFVFYVCLLITAEFIRALAAVKVTLQVNGNTQYSAACPPKKLLGR